MPRGSDPYPDDDDPTEEVPPHVRLLRRHALASGPDVTIDDGIEDEGIQDDDPFAGFVEVSAVEVALTEAEPGIETLGNLEAEAVEPLGIDAGRRVVTRQN